MIKANFHTHTTYCDGKNTPEEMVQAAIALGMTAIGFSGHSHSVTETYGMDPKTIVQYRADILALKEKYAGQIDILLGLEQDSLCSAPDYNYDYLIGAVHAFFKDGHYICVDEAERTMLHNVEAYYGGDFYAYAEHYYQVLTETVLKYDPTFIAHFDLVTKFNEGGKHFDESHPRYRKAALDALHTLIKAGKPFEINTGAISRGYRVTPYPAPFILQEIHDLGGKIILSGDTHACDGLLCEYEQATQLAKKCGFKTAMVITKDGLTEAPL
jgi:histidinol-phosphatase (PHP family)